MYSGSIELLLPSQHYQYAVIILSSSATICVNTNNCIKHKYKQTRFQSVCPEIYLLISNLTIQKCLGADAKDSKCRPTGFLALDYTRNASKTTTEQHQYNRKTANTLACTKHPMQQPNLKQKPLKTLNSIKRDLGNTSSIVT